MQDGVKGGGSSTFTLAGQVSEGEEGQSPEDNFVGHMFKYAFADIA